VMPLTPRQGRHALAAPPRLDENGLVTIDWYKGLQSSDEAMVGSGTYGLFSFRRMR
jgi:hypothetical protein